MFSSHTASCHYCAAWKGTETLRMFGDQHVTHRRAGQNCRDFYARVCFAWQVLCTVHRNIHFSGKKGALDFCRKQSLSSCARIDNSGFVASCRNNFGLDRYARICASNRFLDQQSLRAREFAAACAQHNVFNHRGNLARETVDGKLPASPTIPMPAANFRQARDARFFERRRSILEKANRQNP